MCTLGRSFDLLVTSVAWAYMCSIHHDHTRAIAIAKLTTHNQREEQLEASIAPSESADKPQLASCTSSSNLHSCHDRRPRGRALLEPTDKATPQSLHSRPFIKDGRWTYVARQQLSRLPFYTRHLVQESRVRRGQHRRAPQRGAVNKKTGLQCHHGSCSMLEVSI